MTDKSKILVDIIENKFSTYKNACYGKMPLLIEQLIEIRQAFLSGILEGALLADKSEKQEIVDALCFLINPLKEPVKLKEGK